MITDQLKKKDDISFHIKISVILECNFNLLVLELNTQCDVHQTKI